MISPRSKTILGVVGICVLLVAVSGIVVAQEQEVRADGNPNIDVYAAENTFTPGQSEPLVLQISNDGELRRGQETDRELVTTARSVVVDVDAEETPLEVTSRQRSLGTVNENEPRETQFNVDVPNSAEPGTYTVDVEVSYSYTNRVRQTEGIIDQNQRSRTVTRTVDIEITDDARFRVDNVESTLRVGEEGEIRGELTNVGGEDATNAKLGFTPASENIFALETDVAVGNIDAGDAAEFTIPVEVGSEARAVDKRFDLPVTYRDSNGIRAEDPDPAFTAPISEKRNEFLIEPVDRNITAGTSTELDVELTNNRDERVTDIEAKLFADDPLDSDDDEGFVESLDPGESTTVSFELNAESGATAKTHPVSVDFRYDDARQRSQLSDSYRMAIDVTEGEDDGLPLGIIAIGLVVLAGAGYAVYRSQ